MAIIAPLAGEEIIALLGEILGTVNGIAAVLVALKQLQALAGMANNIQTILGDVQNINSELEGGTTDIETMILGLQDQLRTLTFQVGQPQQSGIAVRLPTTPPPGYGGASSSDVADAVWSQPLPNATPFTALEAVDTLQGWQFMFSNWGKLDGISGAPGYALGGHYSEIPTRFSGPSFSFLDFSTILPTDATIFAWVSRVYPSATWNLATEGMAFERDSLNFALQWWVDLTPEQFREIRAANAAVPARVPPVWPGLAGVTLGASHALVNGLTIAGPMSGVIVTIATVPPPTGFYPFGARRSYVHVGAVIFIDDNGEAEHSQVIGLDDQILVPSTMQSASSAIFRVTSGTTGTARSWVAN